MKTVLIALTALVLCACHSETTAENQMLEIPKKQGQVLDPDSVFVKTWPGKPALYKLKEDLVLAIPPQFQGFWGQRHWITGFDLANRPPKAIADLPYERSAAFAMHMPNFDGFTIENYQIEFDEDLVTVLDIQPSPMSAMEPGASGSYPPNQIVRVAQSKSVNMDKYEDKHGLRCYDDINDPNNSKTCYGRRDSDIEEYLILRFVTPRYESWIRYPIMQTNYFSPKYGGLVVSWRAHVKHLPRWREIDAQIWKYIAQWNIAAQQKDAVKPSNAQ